MSSFEASAPDGLTAPGALAAGVAARVAAGLAAGVASGGAAGGAGLEDEAPDLDGGGGAVGDGRRPPAAIVARLLGSGPWAWSGVAPIGFLGGGRLHTPWGEGSWGAHPTVNGAIFANFLGEEHAVVFDECWAFASTRKRDGDRAVGGARIQPDPTSCDL